MTRLALVLALTVGLPICISSQPHEQLPVRLSWGHHTRQSTPFSIRLVTNNVAITDFTPIGFEVGDQGFETHWLTKAGGGDVDALEFKLNFPARSITTITNL